MTLPRIGPCAPWANTADIDDTCVPNVDSYPDGVVEDALTAASEILYKLSGSRFAGDCETTIRPCARADGMSSASDRYAHSWSPVVWQGICGCKWPGECGSTTRTEVVLQPRPVREVTLVMVDGEVIDPSIYRVDEWDRLVRLPEADGTRLGWPCCSRTDLPATEPGTFEVTLSYGMPVPQSGKQAAIALGLELAKARCPEVGGECRLPQRVQNLTRQGIQMVVLDPQDFLDKGRTGIVDVDIFISAFNPSKLHRRGQVFSPDTFPVSRRVGTDSGS